MGGRVTKKNNLQGGNCPKMGAWTVCRFKGGGIGKKEGNAIYIDY